MVCRIIDPGFRVNIFVYSETPIGIGMNRIVRWEKFLVPPDPEILKVLQRVFPISMGIFLPTECPTSRTLALCPEISKREAIDALLPEHSTTTVPIREPLNLFHQVAGWG